MNTEKIETAAKQAFKGGLPFSTDRRHEALTEKIEHPRGHIPYMHKVFNVLFSKK